MFTLLNLSVVFGVLFLGAVFLLLHGLFERTAGLERRVEVYEYNVSAEKTLLGWVPFGYQTYNYGSAVPNNIRYNWQEFRRADIQDETPERIKIKHHWYSKSEVVYVDRSDPYEHKKVEIENYLHFKNNQGTIVLELERK